jgi:hypothetical protein
VVQGGLSSRIVPSRRSPRVRLGAADEHTGRGAPRRASAPSPFGRSAGGAGARCDCHGRVDRCAAPGRSRGTGAGGRGSPRTSPRSAHVPARAADHRQSR